ncbi:MULTISPECIES: hypothetical protein [unclassified Streptomyces]|uniref:hypothetical protein n=1 Tax=unclassified Streptomyces TaxID=2593676 RepID=UPI002035C998|nr:MULTISPECIES: hypothetical protein [unclassified Streptomyces]
MIKHITRSAGRISQGVGGRLDGGKDSLPVEVGLGWNEVVCGDSFDVPRSQRSAGEVLEVVGRDELSPCLDRGGKYVTVVIVWQMRY